MKTGHLVTEVTGTSVRPARTYSNGRKSPNRPDSGKVTAKGKGVHREVESEGSRRQTVAQAYPNVYMEGVEAPEDTGQEPN